MGILHNTDTEARVRLGDAMKIRMFKNVTLDHGDCWFYVGFTIMGDRKWHYMNVRAKDEMQAYIEASNIAQDYELKEAKLAVKEWDYIKKRIPSAVLTKNIAKAKKLLTDVNKTQVRK
jgi:hypothetical protein